MRDAELRRGVERGMGIPHEPMSVWTDNDHSWALTELAPNHLPRWEELTESMKMFIAWDAGMEFRTSYSLNANIDTQLMARWPVEPGVLMANIEQRLRRGLKRQGLADLPFCYLVETRTKWGKSGAKPHIHGFALCDVPIIATKLTVALEWAFNPDLKSKGRRRRIKVAPGRNRGPGQEFTGRDRWVSYIIKNIDRYDVKLGKRRVFMSRSLTDIARSAWAVRREQ